MGGPPADGRRPGERGASARAERRALMGALDGKVAIVTGAGRGLGRAESLELARQGARVIVNDLGGNVDGTPTAEHPAQQVVEEIKAAGGEATAHHGDVTDFAQAKDMIDLAI